MIPRAVALGPPRALVSVSDPEMTKTGIEIEIGSIGRDLGLTAGADTSALAPEEVTRIKRGRGIDTETQEEAVRTETERGRETEVIVTERIGTEKEIAMEEMTGIGIETETEKGTEEMGETEEMIAETIAERRESLGAMNQI